MLSKVDERESYHLDYPINKLLGCNETGCKSACKNFNFSVTFKFDDEEDDRFDDRATGIEITLIS
jgi:hypothetical protein